MSLVIASNQESETTTRQSQSIYNAWSFRNSLSSVYKIPPNSQVCLQSAKVNLDGRTVLTSDNAVYYDWYGVALDPVAPDSIGDSTSFPILQRVGEYGVNLELTSNEFAAQIKSKHNEYHPNRMGLFDSVVSDSLGYDFTYGFNNSQSNSSKPKTFEPFDTELDTETRFSWTQGSGVFIREDLGAGEDDSPAVGIGLGHPLSVSNGSMKVDFSDANASKVQWGIGLSRDIPNPELNQNGQFYCPPYFEFTENIDMALADQQYFEDFGVHRNSNGELVVRHAVHGIDDDNDETTLWNEVQYWNNASSDLKGTGRYDIDKNSGGYEWVRFNVKGEQVELHIGHAGADDVVLTFNTNSPKQTYFKPISQTCWCLHPVLFVGKGGTNLTSSLTIDSFSGMNITGYNSRLEGALHGWYEEMSLTSPDYTQSSGLKNCKTVDLRLLPNNMDSVNIYTQKGLIVKTNASDFLDYTPAMILTESSTYRPTANANSALKFGFKGRSLVNVGTYTGTDLVFSSVSDPLIGTIIPSIFIRVNGLGQQVLNALTGNKSMILSHLPTGSTQGTGATAGRFYHEPNRDIWLDLNNPYEIQTTDFSIDFVYSNEQYAEILTGQSIVVLYFREKK